MPLQHRCNVCVQGIAGLRAGSLHADHFAVLQPSVSHLCAVLFSAVVLLVLLHHSQGLTGVVWYAYHMVELAECCQVVCCSDQGRPALQVRFMQPCACSQAHSQQQQKVSLAPDLGPVLPVHLLWAGPRPKLGCHVMIIIMKRA